MATISNRAQPLDVGYSPGNVRHNLGLSFDDVLLVPQKGVLDHRADADISSELFDGITLEIPIISAPMESVTEREMAKAMADAGGIGVLHRNMTASRQASEFVYAGTGAAAIGLDDMTRANILYDVGCRIFCLDVAHAHHKRVEQFVFHFNHDFGNANVHLIAGNVATARGALFLADLGVDAVKVGIGPGAACTTRNVTGFGIPQLSAIMDVAAALHRLSVPPKIIADGGIKHSGDIVKAIAAGADAVMLGRLLAGADESPHPGLYWGMASRRVNGHNAPEGEEGSVPRTGPVANTLKELAWGIRSGVSYGGGRNLQELRRYAEFVRVSPLASIETGTRF